MRDPYPVSSPASQSSGESWFGLAGPADSVHRSEGPAVDRVSTHSGRGAKARWRVNVRSGELTVGPKLL